MEKHPSVVDGAVCSNSRCPQPVKVTSRPLIMITLEESEEVPQLNEFLIEDLKERKTKLCLWYKNLFLQYKKVQK